MTGDGRVFLRRGSRFIQMAWYVDGKEYRESSKTTDWDQAKKLLKRRLRERAAHEETGGPFIGPEQKRVRVGQLFDALEADYKLRGLRAMNKVFSHLRPVREAFGDWRAVHVTPEAIDSYISECLGQGLARATVNRRLQLLGQAFRLAMKRKKLGFAPLIRRLSEQNVRQGFLERGDFEPLVKHLPDYLKDFTRFGFLTGWRKGEISSLRWEDVDRAGCVIRLRPEASKNREGRVLALEGEIWQLVERRWKARVVPTTNGHQRFAEYVFHLDGQPVGDFRKAWLSATKAAGLQGKLFHDLRRTAVRNMVRAGIPERVAMAISGHKTRHIFDRYNIVNEQDLREAIRKQQAYLKATPAKRSVVVLPLDEQQAVAQAGKAR